MENNAKTPEEIIAELIDNGYLSGSDAIILINALKKGNEKTITLPTYKRFDPIVLPETGKPFWENDKIYCKESTSTTTNAKPKFDITSTSTIFDENNWYRRSDRNNKK